MRGGWLYILASGRRGYLYIGVTADLARRIYQHRTEGGSTYARRRNAIRLVYAASFDAIEDAIAQEKRIKKWRRVWKFDLIEEGNPHWRDLYDDLNL